MRWRMALTSAMSSTSSRWSCWAVSVTCGGATSSSPPPCGVGMGVSCEVVNHALRFRQRLGARLQPRRRREFARRRHIARPVLALDDVAHGFERAAEIGRHGGERLLGLLVAVPHVCEQFGRDAETARRHRALGCAHGEAPLFALPVRCAAPLPLAGRFEGGGGCDVVEREKKKPGCARRSYRALRNISLAV